jgi:hypothetical protein
MRWTLDDAESVMLIFDEPAHDPCTRPVEYLFLVRRFDQLPGEVLAGEVLAFVLIVHPLWTSRHTVDDAIVDDELAHPACACIPMEF